MQTFQSKLSVKVFLFEKDDLFYFKNINLLMFAVYEKGHPYLNLLSAAGSFKYVWPLSGHLTLKD